MIFAQISWGILICREFIPKTKTFYLSYRHSPNVFYEHMDWWAIISVFVLKQDNICDLELSPSGWVMTSKLCTSYIMTTEITVNRRICNLIAMKISECCSHKSSRWCITATSIFSFRLLKTALTEVAAWSPQCGNFGIMPFPGSVPVYGLLSQSDWSVCWHSVLCVSLVTVTAPGLCFDCAVSEFLSKGIKLSLLPEHKSSPDMRARSAILPQI